MEFCFDIGQNNHSFFTVDGVMVPIPRNHHGRLQGVEVLRLGCAWMCGGSGERFQRTAPTRWAAGPRVRVVKNKGLTPFKARPGSTSSTAGPPAGRARLIDMGVEQAIIRKSGSGFSSGEG